MKDPPNIAAFWNGLKWKTIILVTILTIMQSGKLLKDGMIIEKLYVSVPV